MKALVNLLLAALVVPVFLINPGPAPKAQPPASAETIENAVVLAHTRAREAGGRPGRVLIGG